MTKTYELPNEKMILADVDEKHHTATVSVYALDDLVETVNKTGHWIDEGFYADNSTIHAFRCSECGEHILDYSTLNDHYCRFCGLKMQESEDEE